MADFKLKQDTALQTIIDDDAVLVNTDWAAGDYDNSTNLDPFGIFQLTVQWNTAAPAAGTKVADLYIISGVTGPVYAEGGDAGLGTDDIPQSIYLVASFQSINPSLTVDETLGTVEIPIYAYNRVVLVNTSGQEFDATWILKMQPTKRQVS